jgi:glycerol kinase
MTAHHGRVLVIDVGTSGSRAAIVGRDGTVVRQEYARTAPSTPFPGLVEFDAVALGRTVLDIASRVLGDDPVDAVGITNQRASTVVWDRATGEPVGPGLGWQDLRTVGECISAKADHGLTLAPNQTATKAAWLLNTFDPERARDLCVGTVDSWLVWLLSDGAAHVTDRSNAAVTGLMLADASNYSDGALAAMGIPLRMMASIVDSCGVVAPATALRGSPPIAGLAGDQQASLLGQGCVAPGQAKCTFGTGGMLDLVTGSDPPASGQRSEHGTFPIVAWSRSGEITWGTEAIMLSAGTNVDWLVDDLGILADAAESHEVAASVADADGVIYVPALLGLGTPHWDYGARGTMLGITRGTTRAHVVRAVLDGIAQRGADLVDAAEAESGCVIAQLRVDGGMIENETFVRCLANATGKPIEVAPITECTTLGAGFLAGVAVGVWSDFEATASTWRPRRRVEPDAGADREAARSRWAEATARTAGWIPALSALDF